MSCRVFSWSRVAALAAIAGCSISCGTSAFAAIAVTTADITTPAGATALVNNILGTGITLVSVAPGVGSTTSTGFFTGGLSAGIGIESGIVLTSGNAGAIGPVNTSDSFTGSASLTGDADLNSLGSGTTTDTSALEFTFQFGDGSTGGDLFFNYVFASEEYNEFVNSSFNDVFGFFLDGVNVALIPSTTTPVAINTVNGGNPFTGIGPNAALYNNNDPTDGGSFAFEYDGFTNVFSVSVLGLSAGVHTIKLAIADVSDQNLDSGVFIQGGTFSTDPTPPGPGVPEPATALIWGAFLAGGSTIAWRAKQRK